MRKEDNDGKTYDWTRTDPETGSTSAWTGKAGRNKTTKKEPFVMLDQEACRKIGTNPHLQGFDLRVLVFLLSQLEDHNWLTIHHAGLARQMSTTDKPVSRPAVTRAINRLVNARVLFKGPERTYRLHPGAGWKGERTEQGVAIKAAAAGKLSLVKPSANELHDRGDKKGKATA